MKHITFSILIFLSTYSSFSSAAVLQITAGSLTGATDIDVDGTRYDVEFISQNCYGLFSGCNSNTFQFNNATLASLASAALAQQVFNDFNSVHLNYDTNPQFTSNITNNIEGFFLTPYMSIGPNGRDVVSSAFVNGTGIVDSFDTIQIAKGARPYGWGTYAYWTVSPVPQPATIWLFGLGTILLAGLTNLRKLKTSTP